MQINPRLDSPLNHNHRIFYSPLSSALSCQIFAEVEAGSFHVIRIGQQFYTSFVQSLVFNIARSSPGP